MLTANEHRIATRLVELNESVGNPASRCGEIACEDISCSRCPIDGRNGGHTIGDLRRMLLETEHTADCSAPTEKAPEYSGGSSDYYQVNITSTTTPGRPEYIAECNDIIEALGMNFAEGNAFKAIWRRAAQRTLGKRKAGAKDDGLYDAQKVEFFGARLVVQSKGLCDDSE